MCNDYGNRIPYDAYAEAFSQTRLPLLAPDPVPNLEPRDDIWPTETAPVLRLAPGGVELVPLRWGFAPRPAPDGRPKAGPIINYRSEGRRFGRGRCLVPASHFYEFTGRRSPKSKWRFTRTGRDWFCFAGLWRPAEGDVSAAFTLLTTAPGPDVAPLHDRQMVVLDPADWLPWLDGTGAEADMLAPLPAGSLQVEQVR